MIRAHMVGSVLILLAATGISAAASLYGSYEFSGSHNCNDPSCTTATDVITGVGLNTLQGDSNLTATVMEDVAGNLQPGTFVITSLLDGSEIFGILNAAYDPSVASPAFRISGTAQFTGGTGPYAGFMANETVLGTGFFTGPTSAVGTLVFTPEPESWSLVALSILSLCALRRFRRNR